MSKASAIPKSASRISISRRKIIAGGAAAAALSATPLRHVKAQATTLKVGCLGPHSGHLADQGQSVRRGLGLFETLINRGGGINGQKMELMFFDTKSVPENARVGAEKLISEGATILIGAGDSGATMAALQTIELAKIPLVVEVSAAAQITESGYKYVFRNFPDAPSLVRDAIRVVKDLVAESPTKPKTGVLLHINDTFGTSLAGGIKALWGRLQVPIDIVETISYDPRARDLSVEIAKAKSIGADVLLPVTRVLNAIQIVREMVKQDFNPMGIIGPGSPGPFELEFTKALGKYGDYYLMSTPWYDPASPETKKALPEFTKMHPGLRFELNVGFGYDAALIVADAFRRARSNSSAALAEALRATNIKDHVIYGGPIQFNEKGHSINIGSLMLQNRNGEPNVVLPANIAESKPVFPVPKWRDR